MNLNLKERFWEVDSLRGLAIVMMVVFHLIFDLNYFGVFSFNVYSGFLWYFQKITEFIFIFLVGLSLSLSYSRTVQLNDNKVLNKLFLKYLKRGLKIFFYGLLITLVTWIFVVNGFIIFGILHFIGIAIILEYPLLKHKYANLFAGLIFIAMGIYLSSFRFDFYDLLWLGFIPNNFYTLDYVPLLPWLGVVSLGVFTGKMAYEDYIRQFKLLDLSNYQIINIFEFLGRNSLVIYLIHQPILFLLLYLLGYLDINYFF